MIDQSPDEVFDLFAGQKLTEVTFIQEYIQFAFGESAMTILAPVHISTSDFNVTSNEEHFKHTLGGLIGHQVKSVGLKDLKTLVIDFEDDAVISISLEVKSFEVPESVLLYGPEDQILSLPLTDE